MKKKQRIKYLSNTTLLVALCFSSWAFTSDSNDLHFGEKDLKSFSPNLYGSFSYSAEKNAFTSTKFSLPCISILSEKLEGASCKIARDSLPNSLLNPEIISWLQLPFHTKIEIKLNLDNGIQSKDLHFATSHSNQYLAGYFTIPAAFKKRHVKNLPDLLVFSLKQQADKRLPYLGVITQQTYYNPIPSEELIGFKSNDRFIKKELFILQHFDAFQEDSSFQKSIYLSSTSLENIFVLPEKYSLGGTKQTPFCSSFSTDPLLVDTNSFSHYEQSIKNITFIPLNEIAIVSYIPKYSLISLENQGFVYPTSLTSKKIESFLAAKPHPCHLDKLSSKAFVYETTIPEAFIASINPLFLINTIKEDKFSTTAPLKQLFNPTPLTLILGRFQPLASEKILSSCDFLARHSFEDLHPDANFIISLSKQHVPYKQGLTLSPNFSFENIQIPVNLIGLSEDINISSLSITHEAVKPLTMFSKEPFILSLQQDLKIPFIALTSSYQSASYSPQENLKALNLEKIFFKEPLLLSISPTELYETTSNLQTHLSQEALASSMHRKESYEDAKTLASFVSFDGPCEINSLSYLDSSDQFFSQPPKYLEALALALEEPQELTKTLLEEKLTILEIHSSILDTCLPAQLFVADDVFLLPEPINQGFENSYLLSHQKSLKARLSDYSIIVDKPQEEDRLDPIISEVSAKILLAGKLDQNLSSPSSAVALAHAQRQINKNLETIGDIGELRNYNASEDFVHDLHITPNPKGTGYLFSLTLLPQQQKLETNCPQNYIFLIDRSGSIDKTRFQSFKQGVMKSLLYLKDCDTFNIITFDTEMSKMSHESVFATQATKHGAKRYLENQKRGYQYGVPNIPQVLLSLQPVIQKSSLPTTIVLLTSGKTLENYDKELDGPLLKKQLKANKNSFTLFTAGCQDVSDSNMLEMISLLNRGEYMISQTNAAFPRKLAALVKHATYLAASNVHITTANRSQTVQVEIYPNSPLAPNLYGDKPYTIVGKIDKLADFDLVLQGRFCDNWILIKKKVSFSSARHGGHSILKDFKTFTAYNQYHEYFEDGSIAKLDEWKESEKRKF